MTYYSSNEHKTECENEEYFYCPTDKELVHESQKNVCPSCLLFIPRFTKVIDCICDRQGDFGISDDGVDYDTMAKYKRENPVEVPLYGY